MTDLKQALRLAAEGDRPEADPLTDLARARAAASSRFRRRVRAGLAGTAVAAVLGLGTVLVVHDAAPAPEHVRLVAQRLDATPYTFDLTPTGWSVQAQQPTAVTIAPDDGSTSTNPDDFRGKLVIMFDANPPDGRPLDHDGRRFWISGDSGYTTIATRTVAGEPDGVVRIQYPLDAGWDEDSMVAFLASVHVGPGARQGVG